MCSSERAPWRRSMSRPFRAHLPRGLRLCGPLFEEPGWRGFALHRQLHGPLIGDLILGSLWALWHLPRLSVPQMLPPSGTVMDFVTFSLALIAVAYIIQWVFNNTGAACLWPS
jgi:uncharacterized protein